MKTFQENFWFDFSLLNKIFTLLKDCAALHYF